MEIGPYAVIGEGVRLGDGVRIGAHAFIEHAELGARVRVFPSAVIGTPPQDTKYQGEPTRAIVGEDTVLREFVTIHRGSKATGITRLGRGCYLMAYAHVAHDCELGDEVTMANGATLGGHVEIGAGAVLSALLAVHQFCRIGRLAMVGGGAMVVQDIPPFTVAQGDRARLAGLNLVGLRRRGFAANTVAAIKAAYKTVFLNGLLLEEALVQLEAAPAVPEVAEFAAFLRGTKRGVCRPDRTVAGEAPRVMTECVPPRPREDA